MSRTRVSENIRGFWPVKWYLRGSGRANVLRQMHWDACRKALTSYSTTNDAEFKVVRGIREFNETMRPSPAKRK